MNALQELLGSTFSVWGGVIAWQTVTATFVLAGALAASSLATLDSRSRHRLLMAALVLALIPGRWFLSLARAVGFDPSSWLHQPPPLAVSGQSFVASGPTATATFPPAPAASPDWSSLLAVVWIAGVVVFALRQLVSARRARRELFPVEPATARELDALAQVAARIGVTRRVSVGRSAARCAPCVRGAFTPQILLPSAAAEHLDESELEAILAHELAHVARHDLLADLLARLVCTVLWFHPLAWWAARRAVRERECACDARVVPHVSSQQAFVGGLGKVCRILAGEQPAGAVCASADIEERLARLHRPKNSPLRPWAQAAVTIALVSCLGLASLAVAAATTPPEAPRSPYSWSATLTRTPSGALLAEAAIRRVESPDPIAEPRIFFTDGDSPSSSTTDEGRSIHLHLFPNGAARYSARLVVKQGDEQIWNETRELVVESEKVTFVHSRTPSRFRVEGVGVSYPDGRRICEVSVVDPDTGEVLTRRSIPISENGYTDARSGLGDGLWLDLRVARSEPSMMRLVFKATHEDVVVDQQDLDIPVRPATVEELATLQQSSTGRYTLRIISPTTQDARQMLILHVVDQATGAMVMRRTMACKAGDTRTEVELSGEREFAVSIHFPDTADGEVELVVRERGVVLERHGQTLPVQRLAGSTRADRAAPTAEGMTFELDRVDIHDLLRSFEKIVGKRVVTTVPVDGKVTVVAENVPWQFALHRALEQLDLTFSETPETIVIQKK